MQSCQLASPSCKLGVSAASHILFPQSACNAVGEEVAGEERCPGDTGSPVLPEQQPAYKP